MSSHTSFLSQCGKVLTSKDIVNISELEDVMVCLANIGLYTDLSTQPSKLVWDILTNLINLAVSDTTQYTFTSPLTPHKMSLEIICKLCLHQANIDLLLATPRDRLDNLCQVLAKKLYKSDELAIREMSISIMFYITNSSTALSLTLSLHTPTIPLLISFIEKVEEAAQHVARHQGVAALRNNPSIMGTSLATLRRAASLLAILAIQPSSSKIFMMEEHRLVNLAMSQIVDQDVARSICEAMFLASKEYEAGRRLVKWGW
jgi:AT-rich interactive domain-containing protein 1